MSNNQKTHKIKKRNSKLSLLSRPFTNYSQVRDQTYEEWDVNDFIEQYHLESKPFILHFISQNLNRPTQLNLIKDILTSFKKRKKPTED